jgi:hypothetical protein
MMANHLLRVVDERLSLPDSLPMGRLEVLVRSDNEAVVVNLDIEPVEKPENIAWVDPIHKA